MAIAGGCGATVTPTADVPIAAWCFSESASRVLVSVAPEGVEGLLARAEAAGVAAAHVGRTGGTRLRVDGALDVDLAEVSRAWRDALPAALGHA